MTTLSRSWLLSAIQAADRAGRNRYASALRAMYRREFPAPATASQLERCADSQVGCSPHASQGIRPVEKAAQNLIH